MIEVKRTIPIEVRQLQTNLKNYDSWDYKQYPLTKEEAEIVLKLIASYEEKGGEDGR